MIGLLKPRSLGPSPITYEEKIHAITEPDHVHVLLEYPGHIKYLPRVQAGDPVRRDQTVGCSSTGNRAHASITGTVEEIRTVWSALGHHVPAVVIRRVEGAEAPADITSDPAAGAGDNGDAPWLARLRRAGVPTPWTLPGLDYREIHPGALPTIDVVVIKGVHEEPTIFTSQLLLRQESARVLAGLERVAEITPGATIWLTVARRDAKWARETFGGRAKIDVLPDAYRGRVERQVVPRLAGRAIPNMSAYRDHGVAVLPVEYLLALQDALDNDHAFSRKCVTIAGDDLDQAVTVRIPLGSSVAAVLESRDLS